MPVTTARRGPGPRASGARKLVPLAAPLAAPFVAKTPVRKTLEPLDGYKVLARLGAGGMAEALLARGPAVPELVVVKRLHDYLEDDPQVVQMFVDEARLACRLEHHAIVQTLTVGALEGRRAIVMEFLDGQPLHRVVRRAKELGVTLSVDLVAYWFLNVLDGLHHAHEANDDDGRSLRIVHRDVSPHNIFLTYDGAIKLLDFGIAKTAIQEGRTRTGLLKGKAAYMSPEQARAENVDRRADLWSTGVVLWETLTGARLFKAEHEAGSLNLTLTQPIRSVSEWRRDIPPELEAIVARSLERDRERRYSSAFDMARDLRELLMQRRASVGAAGRELMSVLFAHEIPERRTRIQALLANADTVPISSSLPVVTTVTLPAGDASTVNEFMRELERRHRRTLVALAFAVLCLLGAAAFFVLNVSRAPVVAATERSVVPSQHPEPPAPAAPAARPGYGAPTTPAASAQNATPAAHSPSTATRSPATRHSAEAWRPRDERVVVHAGAPTAATVAPAPERAPSVVHEDGFLTLDTTPWSTVSADGVSLGQTPIVRVRLSAGTHRLVLVNPELGRKANYEVTIEPGKVTSRRIGLE